jgi:hydrogenase maturation protein HypF
MAMPAATAILPGEGRAIRVRGLVQGVGFRPTVWRLARDCGLAGEVWNDAEGVMIRAWGRPADLDRFLRRLEDQPPPLARIDAVEWALSADSPADGGFHIVSSRAGEVHTAIGPDAATCPACLGETLDPSDRRYRYPFTNCTHCGPRLSIVRAVPYDRCNTSMAAFPLCPACREEYGDPEDRRFHAQPTACPSCGPHAWLERFVDGRTEPQRFTECDAVEAARALLLGGSVVAIKGLGGFNLACDACNEDAVARLRRRKRRYAKPFALMARDVVVIRRYCAVNSQEEALLKSAATPIVILPAIGPDRVAEAVAPDYATLGFMLPYTPLHHLLLRDIDRAIVMTSGNLSQEPQCTGNEEARRRLSEIADYGLFHNRDIVNRLDDSVVRVMLGKPRLVRRGRGYAPAPVRLATGFEHAGPLLAFGGELKSAFCLLQDGQAIISQHIGDLEDAVTLADYQKALSLYLALYDQVPEAIAVDMHPDYLSSKLGRERAMADGCRIEEVHHHHAHIASCLAENAIPLDTRPVLGVALDGLGLGPDGTLWGGEFLLADYKTFERVGCFPPVAMPGGAQAVRQPWRNAFAHLEAAIGWERCKREHAGLELVRYLDSKPLDTLAAMIRKGINSPRSSSCGRLFDAVAAAVGLCRDAVSYEGEAAIALESIADARALALEDDGYPILLRIQPPASGGLATMDFSPLWRAILEDLEGHRPAAVMAARFHRGLVRAIVEMVRHIFERENRRRENRKLERMVALSGGSFQNRLLLEGLSHTLEGLGLTVLTHSQVPTNDGGLAFGQAAIAAARSMESRHRPRGKVTSCA